MHTGNIGDNTLVKTFINQQRENYQKITILGEANQDLLSIGERRISPPLMAIGYRFWHGHKQRVETRKKMMQMPDIQPNYIWLGGFLGQNFYHRKLGYQELRWASLFCHILVYYFGDVTPGSQNLTAPKKLINKINNFNSWIVIIST